MNTRIKNIFEFLTEQEIDPIYSVPFCLRLYGKKINEISESSGVTRNFFYKVLSGDRKPNEKIKEQLEALGINPWGNN